MNKKFSNSYKKENQKNFKKLFNLNSIKLDSNDLEKVVFKLYPKIKIEDVFVNLSLP